MIIYYTEDFKEVLLNSSQYIQLSKYRLSDLDSIVDITQIETLMGDNAVFFSPSYGYYEAEGIISGSNLSLSIELPSKDVSIDSYTKLLVYYDNLLSSNVVTKLAFVISSSMQLKDEKVVFSKLNLEPERTIFNISNFNYKCSLKLNQDQDIEFLEGSGLGIIGNLYIGSESDSGGRYVSRESYEAYLQEQRGIETDDNKHLFTTYINKFGLKTY